VVVDVGGASVGLANTTVADGDTLVVVVGVGLGPQLLPTRERMDTRKNTEIPRLIYFANIFTLPE